MIRFATIASAAFIFSISAMASAPSTAQRLKLKTGWKIQNSIVVSANGAAVSSEKFDDRTWVPAVVPSTILANLAGSHVGDGTKDDPFFGKNWLNLPGSGPYYPAGKNYGEIVTPPESPFGHPWWYRTKFNVSPSLISSFTSFSELTLNGITYGAEIWLNGVQLAKSSDTKGTYRHFSYDVSKLLKAGTNTLAVLVWPPVPTDLTPSWVDWNPTPQDKNMGLWREVFITFHGAVLVKHPFVMSDIRADEADLTIQSDVTNSSDQAVTGTLVVKTYGKTLSQNVQLAPHESKVVAFQPTQYPALKIAKPALWWPWQMGAATLHSLEVSFVIANKVSSVVTKDYGIRKIESALTPEGSRLFSVNGKPIFIRGGGWASDILLRFSASRQKDELAYVRQLGLNTVRMEGRFETESFLNETDRQGILVMPGWVCCNAWQNNGTWTQENYDIAKASITDQLLEYRSHASVLAFLYGSDEAPPPALEKIYLDAIQTTLWPNPAIAAASDQTTTVGKTGVKMSGPYAYTPPSYWYVDKSQYGGAWGFNTETSPGVSMPPIESLKNFIPADHFKDVDDIWAFHLGENEFTNFNEHTAAIIRRYGQVKDATDFVKKSEVMDYDNHRAMFEAYARNKYHSATGIVQWMLNSAWPSMMWHLYDYYLRPGAAFYGVKKANAPLHVQYSYDDQSIVVVNSTYQDKPGLRVFAKILDMKSAVTFEADAPVSVSADSSISTFKIPGPESDDADNDDNEPSKSPTPSPAVPETYFVWLALKDANGTVIDRNFYWLSTKQDEFAWDKSDFKMTPLRKESDLTQLAKLAPAKVVASTSVNAAKTMATVTLTNVSPRIAFFIHTKLLSGSVEPTPVAWDDNDVTLLPGETRRLTVQIGPGKASGPVKVVGSGWNVSTF